MSVQFDTLKLAKGLHAAGMDAGVTQGSAEALHNAMAETDFATRADLAAVKAELKADVAAVKADIASVRTDLTHAIELLRRDLTIKLGTFMVAGVSIIIAAIRFMPRM